MAEQDKTKDAKSTKKQKETSKQPKKRLNILFKGLICLAVILVGLAITPFASETANTFLIAQQKAAAKQTAALAAKKAASQTATKNATSTDKMKATSSQAVKPGTASSKPAEQNKNESKVNTLLSMKPVMQGNPSSGGEMTALVTVLNYYNEKVDADTLYFFMPSDDTTTTKDGKIYRANPWKTFVGSPDKSQFGCFAPVIEEAAHDYFNAVGSARQVKAEKDLQPSKLYEYTSKRIPAIVWVTKDLQPADFSEQWYDDENNQLIKWPSNLHCVVLIDKNDKEVTVCDPAKGIVKYSKTAFEKSYNELSQQAVVIQ